MPASLEQDLVASWCVTVSHVPHHAVLDWLVSVRPVFHSKNCSSTVLFLFRRNSKLPLVLHLPTPPLSSGQRHLPSTFSYCSALVMSTSMHHVCPYFLSIAISIFPSRFLLLHHEGEFFWPPHISRDYGFCSGGLGAERGLHGGLEHHQLYRLLPLLPQPPHLRVLWPILLKACMH